MAPSPDAQLYAAATTAMAWVDLSSRELLRLVGPDRVSFLHGMVTNDVNGLPDGGSCHVAMLTAKGAMVGDGRVLKLPDAVLLDTGPGQGEAVERFLNQYLISEDCEVQRADDLAVLGLVGPRAEPAMVPVEARVGQVPTLLGSGLDLVVRRDALPAVKAALSAVPQLDEATREVLRIEAGVPSFGADMTATTIPLEANLDKAIHYQKGCYIGQEVIARATYRGQMNKKLAGLLLGSLELEPGAELFLADKRVGRVTSVATSPKRGQGVALGYVHRDHLAAGTTLRTKEGGEVVVASLPF